MDRFSRLLCAGALFVGAVAAPSAAPSAAPPAAPGQQQVSRSGSVAADVEVEVRSIAGTVRVLGWDRNEVQVEATLGAGTERLEYRNDGDEVEIEVVIGRGRRRDPERFVERSELEIMVPRGASLRIETLGAAITVSDVDGAVGMESTAGAVTYSGDSREIEAGSASGAIEVATTAPGAEIDIEGVAGNVFVRLVDGSVSATALTGSLRIVADVLAQGSFESVSGEIYFEGGLARDAELDVENFSGGIELLVPDDTNADFEISSYSGSIETDFGHEGQLVEPFSPEQEASFRLGAGGAEVSIETFSGTVAIRRR